MMGWDWRLRTAASTGLLFIPGWLQCRPWYDGINWSWLLTCLPEHSDSHQYCLAVLSAEISLEQVGEWTKEMRISSIRPWDLKRSLTCHKILQHRTSGFTSHPKVCCGFFIALKNPSPWPGSNLRPLGPVASTLTTTPPRRLCTRRLRQKQ
jgi:hypothetical protein